MMPHDDGSLADRVTRLEVLRETDLERFTELRGVVNQMNAKLDLLLGRAAQAQGVSAAMRTLFRGAAPAVWLALLGAATWLLQRVLAR